MDTKFLIHETVIEYRLEDFAAWKRGEKELWLSGDVPKDVYNQPPYHFGEYYTLHYFMKARWQGFCFYAIGEWEPGNPKIAEGRKAVEFSLSTRTPC